MTAWMLQLLGVEVGQGARVISVEPLLRAGSGTLTLAAMAFLAAAVGIVWLYRREVTGVGPGRRYLMAGLRIVFLALLIVLLLRPSLRVAVEGDVRRKLIILLDSTQSMSLRDARTDDADRKRLAIARGQLDPAGGLEQPLPTEPTIDVPRDELVRLALASDRLGLLDRLSRDYDLRYLNFGRGLGELPAKSPTPNESADDSPLSGYTASSADAAKETALGDAVREVLSRWRGQSVAGVLVVTDGANNTGVSPLSAATSAGQSTVPLYLWGVGLTRPKDVSVSQLVVPDIGFEGEELTAVVRLRSAGFEAATATLRMSLGEVVVAEKEIVLDEAGAGSEQSVALKFKPAVVGEFALKAEVLRLPGEAAADNNVASTRLRVVDGKIRVLYVETAPRWEFKFLQAMLLRDPRVRAKFVLTEAAASVAEGVDSPYLARFPSTREELLKFDLLILGDVDPKRFTSDQLGWIETHVSRFGAGLVMLAGRQSSPSRWAGTPIEQMLPVEWDRSEAASKDSGGGGKVKLELTPAGRASPMLRLAETEAESEKIWSKLPELFWTARVTRAKPGAEVLVADSDPEKANRFGKMPVVAVQQYGLGTAMFVGTDNLWRWRRNVGDKHHVAFWGQIIQRLALPHLLGESKRTQLSTDKRTYTAGQTATIFARLYSPTFDPITLPGVRCFLEPLGPGGTSRPTATRTIVLLRPTPDQPGVYRGEALLPAAGLWRLTSETDGQTSIEISAIESRVELADTAMNEPLLRDMARASGGAFLREEDLHTLPGLLSAKGDRVRSNIDAEVWSSPLFFGLLLLTLVAEWALRKRAMLK